MGSYRSRVCTGPTTVRSKTGSGSLWQRSRSCSGPSRFAALASWCLYRKSGSRGGTLLGKYILHRILSMIPVLLGVTFFIFLVLHLAPGDPAREMLGSTA